MTAALSCGAGEALFPPPPTVRPPPHCPSPPSQFVFPPSAPTPHRHSRPTQPPPPPSEYQVPTALCTRRNPPLGHYSGKAPQSQARWKVTCSMDGAPSAGVPAGTGQMARPHLSGNTNPRAVAEWLAHHAWRAPASG